jgi:hypothetical protein
VETAREPLLVLDGNLRVKTANCSFYRTFHVVPEETENRSSICIIFAKLRTLPPRPRKQVVTPLDQKRLPSLRTRQPSSSNRPSTRATASSSSGHPCSTASSVSAERGRPLHPVRVASFP